MPGFLKAVLAALVIVAVLAPLGGQAQQNRGFTAGRYAIDLGGSSAGWLHSAEGGHATADVVTEQLGPQSRSPKKHLGNLLYEPIVVQAGFGLTPLFYKDLTDMTTGTQGRRNGAIHFADFDYDEKTVREFYNALITEFGIPACDGSSKNAAYMTVKWAPETTRNKKGDGKVKAPAAANQKQWHPANFRLEIGGLDCTRVSKVDGFTIKQKVIEYPVGEARDYTKEPGALEIPNLAITLSEAGSQTWTDWFEDFVVQGNCSDDREKSGRLVFLAPDRQTELAEVKFFNLGIFKLEPEDPAPNSDRISRLIAHLYCERMEFHSLTP